MIKLFIYKYYKVAAMAQTKGREARVIEVVSELNWKDYHKTLKSKVNLIDEQVAHIRVIHAV